MFNLLLALINIRSLKLEKADIMADIIMADNIDIMIITETWNNDLAIKHATPDGYSYIANFRDVRQGGGIAIIHKSQITVSQIDIQLNLVNFELLALNVKSDGSNESVGICALYRPNAHGNWTTNGQHFLDELGTILDEPAWVKFNKYFVVGDFNVHMNDVNPIVTEFCELLDSHGLKQYIDQPTRGNNILDLVIGNSDIQSCNVKYIGSISDHNMVLFSVQVRERFYRSIVNDTKIVRDWKALNNTQLTQDLINSPFVVNPGCDIETLSKQYNDLRSIFDANVPLKTIKTVRQSQPWYTKEIKKQKSELRKLERKAKKSESLTVLFQQKRNEFNRNLILSKQNYWKKKVNDSTGNSKATWKTINNLFAETKNRILPDTYTSDGFVKFFSEKIEKIVNGIQVVPFNFNYEKPVIKTKLINFEKINDKVIVDIVKSMNTKTCGLDPLPSKLVKENIEILSASLTLLTNKSLASHFPASEKNAHVTPIYKGKGDKNEFSSYRPVSNISYLSKILEKVAETQIRLHLKKNNLEPQLQSAYRKGHSTETALLKVRDDITKTLDPKSVTQLALFDLSAAFETPNIDTLIMRLACQFGIGERCGIWLKSYLAERTMQVSLGKDLSAKKTLIYGVPQGSVLGPLLFVLYTSELGKLIEMHKLKYHLYADDTQVYFSYNSGTRDQMLQRFAQCRTDMSAWMASSQLKLNESKTELLTIGTKYALKNQNNDETKPIRNLGAIFNKNLTVTDQINQTVKNCNFNLRKIGKIRKFLNKKTAEILINALVTSRLDCNNSLLYGAPEKSLSKLQLVQNKAARLVFSTRERQGVTKLRKRLHWLAVRERINYKIIVKTHNALHNLDAPIYLKNMLTLTPSSSTRTTRSHSFESLLIPRTTRKYLDSTFSISAPTLWQSLPTHLRPLTPLPISVFSCHLKTHLFSQSYPSA